MGRERGHGVAEDGVGGRQLRTRQSRPSQEFSLEWIEKRDGSGELLRQLGREEFVAPRATAVENPTIRLDSPAVIDPVHQSSSRSAPIADPSPR